jgi:hypothetical protein
MTKRTHGTINWRDGDKGVRYAVLNGVSGEGVDFFAALPLADGSGRMVMYEDQRKVVAAALSEHTPAKLIDRARIMPKCLPSGSICVSGLFSILASFDGGDIPLNSIVLSYRQHREFFGTLSNHPACKTFVDVNNDNESTLRLLKSIAPIAATIVERRTCKLVEAFVQFCEANGCHLSDDDRIRVVAHAR